MRTQLQRTYFSFLKVPEACHNVAHADPVGGKYVESSPSTQTGVTL
jgi:hypothetical protein